MHLFESSLDIDASVEHCSDTWKKHVDAWLANEDFLNIESLVKTQKSAKSSQCRQRQSLDWDIAANSNPEHNVIWWHHQNCLIDAFGILDLHSTQSALQTHATLKVTLYNQLKGLTGLQIEIGFGELLQRNLKQFRRIVDANMASMKGESYAVA